VQRHMVVLVVDGHATSFSLGGGRRFTFALSPRRELHMEWARRRFSGTCVPPLEFGTIWSNEGDNGSSCEYTRLVGVKHNWHVQPSRSYICCRIVSLIDHLPA